MNGKLTEEGFKLYDKLSKNEVTNIFTGLTIVSDYYQLEGFYPFRLDKDEYIPEFKKLVDLVHKNGANLFMQLVHIGMKVMINTETVYAPSFLVIPNQNKFTKEMTKEDILRIENDFAEAALRAKKAGFDGVEIHGAHFYLVSEFLSPLYNKRTDEYGGSDENRARFLIEIIQKIREKVAGIDCIQISGMKWMRKKTKNLIYAEIGTKLADKIKVPVIVTAGARNVDELNEILNKSNIQYFGIVRPLICESNIVKRWKHGDTKKSKCKSCNACLFTTLGECIFNQKKCDIGTAESAPFQSIEMGGYKVTYLPDGEGYTII